MSASAFSNLYQKMLQESHSKVHTTPNDSLEEGSIVMVVDLGDGRKKKIYVREGDEPNTLARKFCFDNNLEMKLIPVLAKNLRSFMGEAFGEKGLANVSRISEVRDEESENGGNDRNSNAPIRSSSRQRVNTSVSSVFDRLYNQALDRNSRQVQATPEVSKDKQNRNPNVKRINSGVMIYQRNTRLTEQNKRKIQKRIEELRIQQQTELTFKPEINPISKLMVERIRELSPNQSIQQRQSRIKQQKIVQYRIQKQKEQLSKCTFHPQTNRARSCSLLSQPNHSRSTDRFNNLYADSTTRAARREQQLQQQKSSYAFKPRVNPVSEEIVNGITFEQRLRRDLLERAVKQEKGRKERQFSSVVEAETGRQRYRPKTGWGPAARNKDGLPVGEYLYNHRFEKEKAIMKIRQQEQSRISLTQVNTSSERIYQSSKINSFLELFCALDDDGDGVITPTKINISQIDTKVLQVISPLLNEMEQLNAELTEQQFVESLNRLFRTLTVAEKNLILKRGKRKNTFQEQSVFKPQLNQKSMEIASMIRQVRTPGVSLYEFCRDRKQEKQTTMTHMRSVKQREQLRECTFQPRVSRTKNSKACCK